jgi:nucleoside-diphosphate-sugar epimerase
VNAFVTGGSGFLGGALIRRLVAAGARVRALSRRPESDARIEALGATPVRGDLTDTLDGAQCVREGDVVFHAAARVELSGPWEAFERVTVAGTRRLLEAALPQKPARVVYLSSGGVYATTANGPVRAGRTPAAPEAYNYYGRAKLAAEELVRGLCGRTSVSWTILRLPFLYGPGNEQTVRRMTLPMRRGRAFIIGSGANRLATVYVDDAADAAVAAASAPEAAGKIYDVASDEAVTQERFVRATAVALGCPPPRRRIPRGLAWLLAGFFERRAVRRGRTPKYSRALVALMAADQSVDASLIRTELGWRASVSFDEGMRRYGEWVREWRAHGATPHAHALEPAR